MSPRSGDLPTGSELEILNVLWDRGPSTVREVFHQIARARDVGYSTVLKLMQIMYGKGLLERDESSRSHVYEPVVSRERTQRGMVGDLIERAFAGSTSQLVLRALSAKPASAAQARP